MTRNRAIDMLRRMDVRPEGHSEDWEDEVLSGVAKDGAGPEDEAELDQEKEMMQRAMRTLPSEQRRVLVLAYFNGYSHQQIAETLQEPLGTVKTRLRLAMQKLRQVIAQDPLARE
jgi:RNA polymerase sigma-70 factor (ECF subfamily)